MPGPATFIAEKDSAPATFVADEGAAPRTFVPDKAEAVAPVQPPDLSKIKLSPYDQATIDRGGIKPESGMESGTELTAAVGTSARDALASFIPSLRPEPSPFQPPATPPATGEHGTISEANEPWYTKLQQTMPGLFGPPGEQPDDAEVKGAIPAVYRILYGKDVAPGERAEPGLLRFSPKDLFPEQSGYGSEYARQAAGLVNIENLTMLKGLGTLSKAKGPIADWAKAGIAAYFSKQGSEMGGEAAGTRFSGVPLTSQEAAQKDWEMVMGGSMALLPGVEAVRENAAVKPFKEPPISGTVIKPPFPRVEPSEATKQTAMLEVGRAAQDARQVTPPVEGPVAPPVAEPPPAPKPEAAAVPPVERTPEQVKEQTIKDRIAAGIKDEHIQLSITPEQVFEHPTKGKVTVPGVIQVDEIHPDLGNTFSSNPEQLRRLGLDIPDRSELQKLPMGKYTLQEARAKLAELNKPTPPTEAPPAAPVETKVEAPVAPVKKPYNMANLREPAKEFESLVMENGDRFNWIKNPDAIAPEVTSIKSGINKQTMASIRAHNAAVKLAVERALEDIGIKGGRNTLKQKAQALEKLKAWLEEKNQPDDTGIHPEDASTDFLPEEPQGPKLGQGADQGDLVDATQKDTLSLAGEVEGDAAKQAAEAAASKEVKAEAEKKQQDLFNKPPLGFGGGVRPPKTPSLPAADPTPEPTPVTPEQAAAVQTTKTPGLLSGIAGGIKSLLLPSSKGPAQLKAAELLGSKLGPMHQRGEASASSLRPFSRMFDKLGVHREGVAPANNPGIKFMSDMSQGRPLPPKFKAAGEMVQRMFDARVKLLDEAGAALQTVRENYFPGMWTRESRLAFNAAMERMGKDFDPNKATPEQKSAIKAQVDKFLEDGVGSDKDALSFLTRKPLAGKESFRKAKVFDDIMDGAELGLRPISNNPMDLVQLKLAEMDKSVMAHQFFKSPGADVRIINPYEEVGEGRVKINDKYGTIYGPPTVTIPEYLDKHVYQGLLKVAARLGIKHERLMRFPPGPGNRALGLSYQGQNRILSRFGTETSVIAHEIGHQLDVKYGLWKRLTGGGTGAERGVEQKELRAIADETERGKNARKKEEKMAQVMEIYIHAPERMREIAPRIYNRFHTFVQETPELKAFSEIKPGIALEKNTGEKYVGLPILGYRTVPEPVGEILNNYLSSSLYNNKYFGSLYKGWMSAANALNQTQLGMGSAFHAGFTTGEAQISSGANVLKEIYGVLRGNRSVGDLGKSVVNSTVSTIRNPVIGDQVLNAWRNPDGQVNPRIAQVVRAAELGGGGFKLESGLRTEQSIKALRDWYSGHRLRAAARSPIALVELLAKPTMDLLVPRQKAGVFADLAWRIIDQNPGKSLEELTPQFRQAWNRVDARLGQVRYDRLFTNNTAKNVVQGLVRAPGWSGGTIAEIGGGFTDAGKFLSEWVKTGKLPENLPDRTAYVMSLLATVGATNAALTYAFTGTKPHGLDFFAFRTGNKDEQGREERFLIPSYVKDMLAYARHPGETLINKGHPLIAMLNDVARNKDYYGVEIRNPDASLPKQAGQTAAYVVKGFEPFWTRGTRREVERGAAPVSVRTVAPFFGVMPAPRAVTQTPAENLAHELMMQQIPAGARTQAQAERSMLKAAASAKTDYLTRTVKRLNTLGAVRVYEKADTAERKRIKSEVSGKIDRSKVLSEAEKKDLRKRITAP